MPRCPTSKRPGAFNAHNPATGERFSPTGFSLTGAHSSRGILPQRPVRRAAKRKTLYAIWNNEAVVAVTQTFLRVRSFFTTLAFQEIIKDPGEDSKVYYISNVSESIKEFNIINAEIKSAIAKLKRTGDV